MNVRYEDFIVMKTDVVVVLWVLTPDDGHSMVVRNAGILSHHYTVSQPTKRRLIQEIQFSQAISLVDTD